VTHPTLNNVHIWDQKWGNREDDTTVKVPISPFKFEFFLELGGLCQRPMKHEHLPLLKWDKPREGLKLTASGVLA
jgi:hypothetical protein